MKIDANAMYKQMTKKETMQLIKNLKELLIKDYCRCDICKTKIGTKSNSFSCNHECDEIFKL